MNAYERYEPEKPVVTLSDLNPRSKALKKLNAKKTMRAKAIKSAAIVEATPLKKPEPKKLKNVKSLEQSFPDDEISLMSIPRQSLH